MNARTFLIEDALWPRLRNKPENITGESVWLLAALNTNDGFVKMSMETWKRLELFISILRESDCAREIEAERYLNALREEFNEQTVQPSMACTGEGEMAGTKESQTGGDCEAGSLPKVRPAIPEREIASPSP
jgi:hypothetical protein